MPQEAKPIVEIMRRRLTAAIAFMAAIAASLQHDAYRSKSSPQVAQLGVAAPIWLIENFYEDSNGLQEAANWL